MKLQPDSFDKIKAGTKMIESRLYDKKRQLISLGDNITFYRQPNLDESLTVRVVALLRYPSFSDMIRDFPCAWFGGSNQEELLTQMRQFYPEDDEKKYGVLGIKIQRVAKD